MLCRLGNLFGGFGWALAQTKEDVGAGRNEEKNGLPSSERIGSGDLNVQIDGRLTS